MNIPVSLRRRNTWLLLAAGLMFWLLNALTCMFSDDYPVSFGFRDYGIDLTKPVRTFSDVVVSQYYHYLTQHGRVLTIGTDQLLMTLRCKPVFDVLNTLFFVAFLYLIQVFSRQRGWATVLLALALMFGLFRAFGEVFLWQTGSINYLWGIVLNLVLLYALYRHCDSNRLWPSLWLTLFAFVVGTWQESFSIGIGAALVIGLSYSLYRRQQQHIVPWLATIAYLAGILFYVASPGTQERATIAGLDLMSAVVGLGGGILYVLAGQRIFWILVVTLFVRFRKNREGLKDFVRDNWFFLTAILFQMLFLMFVGKTAEPRAFFGIESFSLILLFKALPPLSDRIGIVAGAVFLTLYALVVHLTWNNYRAMQDFYTELDRSDGLVFFDIPQYTRTDRHYLGSSLLINHQRSLFDAEAAYYGKDSIMVLPKRLYQELYLTSSFICPENRTAPWQYTTPELNFIVVPLKRDGRLPQSKYGCEIVTFPSGRYALMNKPKRYLKRHADRE
ncbi:MAG: hypothetical protein IJ559_02415 [Prevotella sp.]|nr:hypothetical protein [Prevotella sp.]